MPFIGEISGLDEHSGELFNQVLTLSECKLRKPGRTQRFDRANAETLELLAQIQETAGEMRREARKYIGLSDVELF